MVVQRIEEFQINAPVQDAISRLLSSSFPHYPGGQTFFKQVPHFRFLGWDDDNMLIAHMAIEYRMINNSGRLYKIFGIADLCVAEAFQHKKLASYLLNELEALGKEYDIDFLVLLANDHDLYLRNGFALVKNECQWLMIHNRQSLGIAKRRIERTLMIKPLKDRPWENGLVDFLGHIF